MINEKEEVWGNRELPGLSDEELFNTNWNRKRTRYQREWFKEFNQRKARDPKFLARLRAVMQTQEYKDNLRASQIAWWNGLTEQQQLNWRKRQSSIARDAAMVFASPEQAHEIFWQCWGEDRGEKLYRQLAEQYGVTEGGIINLVRGSYNPRTKQTETHYYCPVDLAALEAMKQEWIDKYQSYTITAISPGSDQLEKYDELYCASDWYAKVDTAWKLTTPSVVYYCRYVLKNPTPERVRDYCDSIGIPRLKNDLGQYKMLLNRFQWLSKRKSKTYTFDSMESAAEFFTKHSGKKIDKRLMDETIRKGIALRDVSPFAGWILIKTNK